MIGWSAFGLFIGRFMLLINYNQAKILYWRKKCGTRTNDNVDFTCSNTPPFVVAFTHTKLAMDNRDAIRKTARHA